MMFRGWRFRLRDFYHAVKNIPRNIARLISYFPIIWQDRDWDYCFFFYMMRHKLKRIKKRLEKGIFVGWERQAKIVQVCIFLINRIVEDNYHENASMWHDQKWGNSTIERNPIKDGKYYSIKFSRPQANTPDLEEEERREFRRVMDHASYMAKQDLDYLFRLLAKNVTRWWD